MFDLKMFNRLACAAAVLGAVTLQGCATGGSTVPPELQVTRKANERWKDLVAGEWSRAYAKLVPSYRELHDLTEYKKTFKGDVKWVGAEVASTTCEPEKCNVRVKLTVELPMARRPGETLSTYIDETWLHDQGNWYYYQAP